MVRMRLPLAILLCLSPLPTSCGDGPPRPGAPTAPAEVLSHDFGTIPHGEKREHRFLVPTPTGRADIYPIGFATSCSCGLWDFLIRSPNGDERPTGPAIADNVRTVQPGEELLLRLIIDTSKREAVDAPPVTFRGGVLLHADGDEEPLRVPVTFVYAIDAPIRVAPAAHVDFGALPFCRSYAQTLELRADRTEPPVRMGPVRTSDPRLSAELRQEEGATLLDVRFAPRPDDREQNVSAAVYVDTDLPDYALTIPVTGQITGAIIVEPSSHLGFNKIDFMAPAEVFAFVSDHDPGRDPAFVTLDIRNVNGASLADHFRVDLSPVDNMPRMSRMVLHYLGGFEGNAFRGIVRLAKPGSTEPLVEITFNAVNSR